MTTVRQRLILVGRFKPTAPVGPDKTEKPLPEHNVGLQKEGVSIHPSKSLDKTTFCGEGLRFNPSQQRVRYSSRRPRASVRHTSRRHA